MKQENQEKRVQAFELAFEQCPQLMSEILDELKQISEKQIRHLFELAEAEAKKAVKLMVMDAREKNVPYLDDFVKGLEETRLFHKEVFLIAYFSGYDDVKRGHVFDIDKCDTDAIMSKISEKSMSHVYSLAGAVGTFVGFAIDDNPDLDDKALSDIIRHHYKVVFGRAYFRGYDDARRGFFYIDKYDSYMDKYMDIRPEEDELIDGLDNDEMEREWEITETLKGTFDEKNDVLTISGTGAISSRGAIPFWCEYRGNIITVNIQDGVTSIGKSVFFRRGCFTSITIPNSVTTIEERAFAVCSGLTSITIGNSVTTIGDLAFFGCSRLRNVVVLSTTPPSITSGTTTYFPSGSSPIILDINKMWHLGDSAGDDCYSTCDTFDDDTLSSATLTVPKGCKDAYESTAGWKDFGTIVEMNN